MTQKGFYFNMRACIGCRTCQVVCKDKNRLDVGTIYRHANTYVVGKFPEARTYNYSHNCNHCAEPACLPVCPVGAVLKLEDGTVVIVEEMCIGCGACVASCPYGVPQMIEKEGIVGKCDACYTLTQKGENPACVDGCAMRALDFGDLEELKEKYGADLVDDIAVLPNPSMTVPSLLIDAKDFAFDANFEEMFQ